MKVSLNTIKKYTKVDLPIGELVHKINQQLGGVEAVTDLTEKYKDALIVAVAKCEKHPNADRLNVCLIDDSGIVKDIERDEDGLIQVVCGAPNVRGGMLAVWLPPASVVPASFNDEDPFVLEARELRGVVSNGMLASPKELSFGDSHEGILEITENDMMPGSTFSDDLIGRSFADVFGLNDVIIDIENKMFTHRPDLFGQLGVAREVAGIQHDAFTSPDWYKALPAFNSGEGLELVVKNDASAGVPRFMSVALKNVTVSPSPLWLQSELVRLGGKPINNIVDATNYVMLLTAQPTHAYDYDKLRGHMIGTRMARKDESIMLLNGKTYELAPDDIVIVDTEGPVGLAGIMGGGDSEVSSDTKNIVLEVATFDMYTLRRSSMRHGLFTDALTRFNKGQSPLQNDHVLSLLMSTIFAIAGGELASQVYDARGQKPISSARSVTLTASFINERLGLRLSAETISTLLKNVEFTVEKSIKKVDTLKILPPFWRTDIELPEDVVEEVGRLYGFDKLPRELPIRSIKPAPKNRIIGLKHSTRSSLARAGANEVLTYSFINEKVMKKAGQDASHAYRLSNALSPDLQYYRTSLMPCLLDKVYANHRAGYDRFALFELGKTHFKTKMDKHEPALPDEDDHVALVISYDKKNAPEGALYYSARAYLERIMQIDEITLEPFDAFDLKNDAWATELCSAYEPARSALIVKDERIRGVIGEFTREVRRNFKLSEHTAGFEVHMDLLGHSNTTYKPLSRYPNVFQDISLRVKEGVSHDAVYSAARKAVEDFIQNDHYAAELKTINIYQPEDKVTKTITLRLTIASYSRTLTDKDVSVVMDGIEKAAAKTTSAERA